MLMLLMRRRRRRGFSTFLVVVYNRIVALSSDWRKNRSSSEYLA